MTKEDFMDMEKKRVEAETRRLAKEGKLIESISSDSYDKYIKLQKTKLGFATTLKYIYNYTLGWVLPNYDVYSDDNEIIIPINAAKLIDDLIAVHGHEVLIDGTFNADPHPGNILYIDGKLGLIDYGQVKRISDEARMDVAKMILLVDAALRVDPKTDPNVDIRVHRRAKTALTKHCRKIGMKTKKDLDDTYYEMTTVYFGRMDAAWIYPRNLIQWTDYMESKDPIDSIDDVDYLVMINMSSMMLRGLGEHLQQYQ